MPKISKKNQTREEEERERAAMAEFRKRRSPHFMVGTSIVVDNRVGLIVSSGRDGLVCDFGPGLPRELVTPINWGVR